MKTHKSIKIEGKVYVICRVFKPADYVLVDEWSRVTCKDCLKKMPGGPK